MTTPSPGTREAARQAAIETTYADGHDPELKGKALAEWAVGKGWDLGHAHAQGEIEALKAKPPMFIKLDEAHESVIRANAAVENMKIFLRDKLECQEMNRRLKTELHDSMLAERQSANDIARLTAENTRLQERCARLERALERMHGLAESALIRFKGWIPWDYVAQPQHATENAFIEDSIKLADKIAREALKGGANE